MCCIRRIKQALVVLLFLCTPDLVLGRKAAEANGALRNADFDLTPEWVMSIQNGPAVLRLRYKYNGANAVRIKTRRDRPPRTTIGTNADGCADDSAVAGALSSRLAGASFRRQ